MSARFGLVAAVLLVLVTGCGSRSTTTRLTIQQGQIAYDLRCDPPTGSVADPAAICRALAREPELLVDGPAIVHSCPESPTEPKVVGVRGRYRGYRVRAVFADTTCGWVPGQGGALAEWTFLLHGSGPGRRVTTRPSSEPTRVDAKKAQALREKLRELLARRKASGDAQLDDLALTIIRDEAELGVAEGDPLIHHVDVYATTSRRAGRAVGDTPYGPNRRVFVVVYHYAYLDYAGHKHVATDGGSYAFISPRTMEGTDYGLGGLPSLRSLGRPVTLRF